MTRLEARIVDFAVVRDADRKIAWWRFRFGRCEDFAETMGAFKDAIVWTERTPDPERAWLWEVRATPANRRALGDIFDNFEECLQLVERQIEMFPGTA